MEEITVSDGSANGAYINYLYNAVMGEIVRTGGGGELLFGEQRVALRLKFSGEALRLKISEKLSEILGIGYKYAYLSERLKACLSRSERKLLLAALIAADFEGDRSYILARLDFGKEFCLDGFFSFRLGYLREKWSCILDYIPGAFSSSDLVRFCEYMVGESKHRVYLKGNVVFGENLTPLRRSRLIGEEDVKAEIMLSDAGFVYCLGEVEESVGNFLQKYYAERAIFS